MGFKGLNIISAFRGDYRFLSNFYISSFSFHWVDGNSYSVDTVEHAYQACKATNDSDFYYVQSSPTAAISKTRGQEIKCRYDWDDVKFKVMYQLLKKKFDNPYMKNKLIETGDAILIEGNDWGDEEWGMIQGSWGNNKLGKLLMQVRKELLL